VALFQAPFPHLPDKADEMVSTLMHNIVFHLPSASIRTQDKCISVLDCSRVPSLISTQIERRNQLQRTSDCCGEQCLGKTIRHLVVNKSKKSKAIIVTGRAMLRIPHCLDNRLTVNIEILATYSSTYSPVCTSQEAHSVSIK
jgi:hypothetical protein